jgi:hypothetical protein
MSVSRPEHHISYPGTPRKLRDPSAMNEPMANVFINVVIGHFKTGRTTEANARLSRAATHHGLW